jgi:hypothetical protein
MKVYLERFAYLRDTPSSDTVCLDVGQLESLIRVARAAKELVDAGELSRCAAADELRAALSDIEDSGDEH